MKTRLVLLMLLASVILSGCNGKYAPLARRIAAMKTQHPEMHLQDVYKTFYQDRFGSSHMITDSMAVRNYLDEELLTPDNADGYYEKAGMNGRYVRVNLKAVQDSLITADELFSAFLRSANAEDREQDEVSWSQEWQMILAAIEAGGISLPDYENEKKELTAMIEEYGDVAVRHSDAYRNAYNPHYRIVRRDIFMQELLPKIEKGEK